MLSPIALILPVTFWVVLFAICGFAWRKGRAPERMAALAFLVAAALSVLVKPETMSAYLHFEAGTFVVDLVLMGFLVGLALLTPRNWALWAAGFHLAAVATHITILATDQVMPPAYALLQGFWGYPVLVSLALGANGCGKRRGEMHRENATYSGAPVSR